MQWGVAYLLQCLFRWRESGEAVCEREIWRQRPACTNVEAIQVFVLKCHKSIFNSRPQKMKSWGKVVHLFFGLGPQILLLLLELVNGPRGSQSQKSGKKLLIFAILSQIAAKAGVCSRSNFFWWVGGSACVQTVAKTFTRHSQTVFLILHMFKISLWHKKNCDH